MTNYFVETVKELTISKTTLHTTFYIKATSVKKANQQATSLAEAGAIVVKCEAVVYNLVKRGQHFAKLKSFVV